jgi:hypothetical protein
LSATGFSWPNPAALSRAASLPLATIAAITLFARASDSFLLEAASPTLSVWPSTPSFNVGLDFSSDAISLTVADQLQRARLLFDAFVEVAQRRGVAFDGVRPRRCAAGADLEFRRVVVLRVFRDERLGIAREQRVILRAGDVF